MNTQDHQATDNSASGRTTDQRKRQRRPRRPSAQAAQAAQAAFASEPVPKRQTTPIAVVVARNSNPLADEDKGEFFRNRKWWTTNDAGEPILVVNLIPIDHVGTDDAQAQDMLARTVAVPPSLGITNPSFGFALSEVVEKVANAWYDKNNTPSEERQKMNGYRPDKIQAPLKYKARSLNGVWATPPYLHNGSVPTIYALLSRVKDRPSIFYLGSREYLPGDLGYAWKENIPNSSRFDTSIRGNSNKGHEFSNEKGAGVIGPELTDPERRALIEFIKTL